jgi:cellulose synthase/poly-beta-1,6-N-acetylglucosamine synthase-like glycosyltransferase/DNA-binding NarL/FixJ family response regulator
VIRVLVADDQSAVRDGVRTLLAAESEIAIVGEADDGSTALNLARRLRPDLIVLDDSMPGLGSLDVARMVLTELPGTAVVFLARDPALRNLALAAGATAFVPKDAPSEELLRALRASVAGVTARQQLSALRPEGRRAVELLLGSRVLTWEQVQDALAKRANGESLAATLVRLGLIGQPELADILARATDTPFVSLSPYPEIGAPIDPTETRLSSARLVDPVERDAARLVPFDVARGLSIVVTAADRGHGVIAMSDPLDDAAFAEAERHSKLRLTRVTATADDIKETLDRVWNGGGSRQVIFTGSFLGKLYTSTVLTLFVGAGLLGFGLLVRDALAPRFAFSLFALLCGLFFFLYALKYYVTIASVILITLFGDPAKFQGRHASGNGNGNGHVNGNGLKADGQASGNGQTNGQHREGYRTLRGEKLSEHGNVVVTDPWQKMGEIRLPPDRQPFVSVHLALYNEGRVVDRLLEACTSFDYENYEVIVADDSTDETVEKLKRWKDHPRVRVIHRSSRKGFKGGALQEALRRMNPRTEFVMVFDADFVPPADAIWHFLDYFGRLTKAKNGNGNGHHKNGNGVPTNGDRLAVVQGYQWHMLNASENWITKGVRAEFSGSYVLERAGQELFGAMKMISGSVYMIRADILRKLGWSTSITEDWELTIRLYLAGYKVLYTPYIQAPAECVSEVRRLVKQRMRWAEGHTYNVRKYFWPILRSPNLTWQEKLEFVYYAPYYLQSVLFTVATLAWVVGVLILGQKLPMWGELFGWSLVVSNALALPLMNLAGVLLEGSLKRDALGLLSFIGLSWILVPFQAWASIKALFERKEGGWVRTPKSGRVTESLSERFHLARLMPWELPRRKRGQSKPSAGAGRVAAAAVVVIAAAGILTVGALSIRAAATSGIAGETDLAIPALLGTAVPLLVLALGWLRLRRRMTAIVLAFTLGLGTNVLYLAHAVPAAAVTDNSSVFTFKNSSAHRTPDIDMAQGYTPAGATASTCPAGAGYNWTCQFTSDQFSAGQTLNAGTATADLYLENAGPLPVFRTGAASLTGGSGTQSSLAVTKPTGIANGDVLIAHIAVRGDVHTTLSGPAGWTTVDRINQSTSLTLGVFWHAVANAASEPASYTFSWTGNFGTIGTILAFQNVDNTNPVDGHAGNPEPGSTATKTAPAVTAAFANELQVVSYAQADNLYCNYYVTDNYITQGAGGVSTGASRTAIQTEYATKTLAAAGTTNAEANLNCSATPGASHQLTLKQATAVRTCNISVSVNVVRPITFVASSTATMNPGPSLVLPTPAGTAQNDVMIASMTYTQGVTVTAPSGWSNTGTIFCQGTTMCLASYYMVAGATIAASYTWTIGSSSTVAVGTMSSYRYADPSNPVDTYFSGSTASGTQHATSGCCSTANAQELVFIAYAVAPTTSTATFTEPTGTTERVDTAISASPAFFSMETVDFIKGPAGNIPAQTTTSSVAGVGLNKVILLIPGPASSLGSATASIASPSGPTLVSTPISTSGWTFQSGDQLALDVVAPNDSANCAVRLSYDSTGAPSKVTVATIVPEGVAGLLLLAPALPFGARWWKRRRP